MGTNSYVTKLKAQIDRAITQRDHWKQLAENRNSIVVTEVCPESRSVEEYIIDADSVRSAWRLIRRYREQAEALRAENGRLSEELDKTELRALKFIHQCNAHVDLYRELKAERDQLSTELEAARGLLRHASSVLGSQGWEALTHEIDTFLTATPTPVVRDHTEQHLEMAEQGERQEAGDMTLTPDAQKILTECIGAHAYVLQALVNGRPDLALTEAKKWVDGFKEAADHHRQAQRQA